jgi:hypothetical protein
MMALTSVTDNLGQTWTHCPGAAINDAGNTNGTLHAIDCYYILATSAGVTSVTANWTNAGLSGTPTTNVSSEVFEYSYSGSLYYDTSNAFLRSGTCSPCTGPAGLLSGSNDIVVQSMFNADSRTINSIGGTYSTVFDTDTASNALFAGFSAASGQGSYAVPSWTLSGTNFNPSFYSTVAFGSVASPAPTGQMLVDFSGGTNGVQPTTTAMANSTFSGWGVRQGGFAGASAGVTACTSVIGTNLPATTTINGAAKTGGSALDFCGVTALSGSNVGYYEIDLGISNSEAMYAPVTVGFSFRSDCPANVDCGALGVRTANPNVGGFYSVAHASPLGDGKWCFEVSSGLGCQEGTVPFAYAPSTNYRINFISYGGLSGKTNQMVVCADGPGGAVLGTIDGSTETITSGISAIQIGITGEEPTTAGYHYYFRNVVVGGKFSTTSCF